MQVTDIPIEQTTAATDAVLAVLALVGSIYLQQIQRAAPWKANLWSVAFLLLAVAAALGAVVHGLVWDAATSRLLWHPLNLALGLVVALFVVGVVYDVWGKAVARRALPVLLVVVGAFFLVTLVLPGSFLVFVISQALGMLFVLGCYGWLAWQERLPGAGWMAAGVLVSIVAAGVQVSGSVTLTLIWQFDHNGVFHLMQMLGLLLLLWGLRVALVGSLRRRRRHYWNWGQE